MATWNDYTDEELMVLYREGEPQAFNALFDKHSGKVLGYLKKHLRDSNEAEDLMQVAFMKLHQSRDRYNEEYPFLTWLFTIARNTLIDSVRKKKAIPTEDETLHRMSNATQVAEIDTDQSEMELGKLFAALPAGQRQVLELRFAEGLSFEEISAQTGLTKETARKRVSRAVEKIKKVFG